MLSHKIVDRIERERETFDWIETRPVEEHNINFGWILPISNLDIHG